MFRSRIIKYIGVVLAVCALIFVVAQLEKVLLRGSDDSASAPSLGEYEYLPLSEFNSELSKISGVLDCERVGQWAGFKRELDVLVSDRLIAYDKGEVDKFIASTNDGAAVPATLDIRFEMWRGVINGDIVSVKGWYVEGNDTVKPIEFSGTYRDGELRLRGKRSSRDCVFDAASVAPEA